MKLLRTIRTLWALLTPNIDMKIKFDWHPVYRLKRWLKKTRCQNCLTMYRDMEEGCVGGENLCGKCLKEKI